MDYMQAQRSAADVIHRLSKNQFNLNNKFYEAARWQADGSMI